MMYVICILLGLAVFAGLAGLTAAVNRLDQNQ